MKRIGVRRLLRADFEIQGLERKGPATVKPGQEIQHRRMHRESADGRLLDPAILNARRLFQGGLAPGIHRVQIVRIKGRVDHGIAMFVQACDRFGKLGSVCDKLGAGVIAAFDQWDVRQFRDAIKHSISLRREAPALHEKSAAL